MAMGPVWVVPKVRMKSFKTRGSVDGLEPIGCDVIAREASRSDGAIAASKPLWSEVLQPLGRDAAGVFARRVLASGRAASISSEQSPVMDQVFFTCDVKLELRVVSPLPTMR